MDLLSLNAIMEIHSISSTAVNIPYDICVAILEHHGFNHQTANSPAIKPNQLTAILHDIYFAAEKCGHFAQSINFDLGRCSALLAGFLWAVFDP